jgi:hypothetical protein
VQQDCAIERYQVGVHTLLPKVETGTGILQQSLLDALHVIQAVRSPATISECLDLTPPLRAARQLN